MTASRGTISPTGPLARVARPAQAKKGRIAQVCRPRTGPSAAPKCPLAQNRIASNSRNVSVMSIWPTRAFHMTRAEVRKIGAASHAVARSKSRPASAKRTRTEPTPAKRDGSRAATSSTPPRSAPNSAMFQKWSGGLWV